MCRGLPRNRIWTQEENHIRWLLVNRVLMAHFITRGLGGTVPVVQLSRTLWTAHLLDSRSKFANSIMMLSEIVVGD